jgi:hypothetical protein
MDQQEIILATIGDLEISRRQLIMEIQARDTYIKELEEKLGITHDENPGAEAEPTKNGSVEIPV